MLIGKLFNFSELIMNQVKKIIGTSLLLAFLASWVYPTYQFTKDFVQTRDARMQQTSYNFSKYLRYGS